MSGKRSIIHGKGFFCVRDIVRGEVVAVKAGHIMDRSELALRIAQRALHASELQISTNLYIAPMIAGEELASMIYINHSCDPNAGVMGNIIFVAMRHIRAGEEITMDYAMHRSDRFSMSCNCKSVRCRHVITGDDWQDPELQARYEGYFSAYLHT